eukprot:TRINITY_DN8769_c0_g1_i1.p1 TRINITY_DN8769_c0_g1~~TRINITY_DN8769_c0_g1_i1.p1  ORF type:complete len:179 (+),score=68.26 TRINITY_DN8769_c0_g1_i1:49-537(+)
MGEAANLVMWVKISAVICLLLGFIGILNIALQPGYWYRGILGLFGVGTGLAGFYTLSNGTARIAKMYLFSLVIFTISLFIGGSIIFLKTQNQFKEMCLGAGAAIHIYIDCQFVKYDLIGSIFITTFSIFVLIPLAMAVRSFVIALNKEGPLNSDKHISAMVA